MLTNNKMYVENKNSKFLQVAEANTDNNRLVAIASDTKERLKCSIKDIYQIGLNLIEAKELIAHGNFSKWLKAEINIDIRTAQRYMNVAELLTKNDAMSFLLNNSLPVTPAILYEIASPSIPNEAREEIINRLASEEKVTRFDARKIIHLHKAKTPSTSNSVNAPVLPSQDVKEADGVEVEEEEFYLAQDAGIKLVKVSSILHPRYGSEGTIASDPPNNWQQILEFPDGSREAIANKDLDFGEPKPVTLTKLRTYTQSEFDEAIKQIKEEYKRTIERLESDILCRLKSETRFDYQTQMREELEAVQKYVDELKQKNIDLHMQLGQMQHLQVLKEENDDLKIENERLKDAAKDSAVNQWDSAFSTQAAKALNEEVLKRLNAQEPELHLRSLSRQLPPLAQMPETLKLLGLFLDLLVNSYRENLSNSSHWAEFEPTATSWIAIKDIVWTKLTPDEQSKIVDLKKQSERELDALDNDPLMSISLSKTLEVMGVVLTSEQKNHCLTQYGEDVMEYVIAQLKKNGELVSQEDKSGYFIECLQNAKPLDRQNSSKTGRIR